MDYQGTCKFSLVKSSATVNPSFEVLVKNYNRNGIATVSYVLYVEVKYKNVLIHMEKRSDTETAPINVIVSL